MNKAKTKKLNRRKQRKQRKAWEVAILRDLLSKGDWGLADTDLFSPSLPFVAFCSREKSARSSEQGTNERIEQKETKETKKGLECSHPARCLLLKGDWGLADTDLFSPSLPFVAFCSREKSARSSEQGKNEKIEQKETKETKKGLGCSHPARCLLSKGDWGLADTDLFSPSVPFVAFCSREESARSSEQGTNGRIEQKETKETKKGLGCSHPARCLLSKGDWGLAGYRSFLSLGSLCCLLFKNASLFSCRVCLLGCKPKVSVPKLEIGNEAMD